MPRRLPDSSEIDDEAPWSRPPSIDSIRSRRFEENVFRSWFLYRSLFAYPADRSVVQVEKVSNLSLTISATMHRLDNPWVRGPIFVKDVFSRVAARGQMVDHTVKF